jgi:hypothetical protein
MVQSNDRSRFMRGSSRSRDQIPAMMAESDNNLAA